MSRRYVSRASSRGGGGALLLPVGLGTAAVGDLAGSTPLFGVGAVTAAVLVLLPWMVLYSLLVLFSMLQNHALGPLSGVVVGGITLRPDELILASFVVCVYALSRPGSRRRWAGTEWMLVAYLLLQAVTSYLNSPSFHKSLQPLGLLAVGVLAYLVVSASITTNARLIAATRVFLGLLLANAVFGVLALVAHFTAGTNVGLSTHSGFGSGVY